MIQHHHWVVFNDETSVKATYIFRDNNELIISEKGIAKVATWDNLGNQTLLLKIEGQHQVFKRSFIDETFLVLNLHDTDSYLFLLNETKLGKQFTSIQEINSHLSSKYSTNNKYINSNFEEKRNLEDLVIPGYTEGEVVKHYQLFASDFYTTIINFKDGKTGTMFQRNDNGKYYYYNRTKEVQ